MTEWKTDVGRGLSVGIGLMVAIVLVDVGLIWLAAIRPLTIGTFIIGLAVLFSLGLLALIGYWLQGLSSSGYFLDRNALVIHWGPMEQTIPTRQIERVLTGDKVEGHVQFHGGMWPGHCVGYGEVPGAGPALFYATVPPRYQIYIVTPGLTYGISPANAEGFLESLHKRLQMGPTQIMEQSSRRPGILNWAIWQDRVGLALLAVGFLAILALTGRFPSTLTRQATPTGWVRGVRSFSSRSSACWRCCSTARWGRSRTGANGSRLTCCGAEPCSSRCWCGRRLWEFWGRHK